MRWSDRNAPMPFADTSFQFPLKRAPKSLHFRLTRVSAPELAGICEGNASPAVASTHLLRAKQRPSGAFNSSHVLPGGEPVSFTLLNYLGSPIGDVMTLAHELGHGVHWHPRGVKRKVR